jgi:hypothetical protein
MFDVYRYTSINPNCIYEPVVCHSEVAVVLRVHHCSVASLRSASEQVIIPDLIVRGARLLVEGAYTKRLVNQDSTNEGYIYHRIGDVHVGTLL